MNTKPITVHCCQDCKQSTKMGRMVKPHIPLGGLGSLEANLNTEILSLTTMFTKPHNSGMFQIGKTGHLSIPRSMLNTSNGLKVGRGKLALSLLKLPCLISSIPNLHLMSSNYY